MLIDWDLGEKKGEECSRKCLRKDYYLFIYSRIIFKAQPALKMMFENVSLLYFRINSSKIIEYD